MIRAHANWKGRLFTAINGGEVPDPAIACDDSRCDLGKWITGQRNGPCAATPAFTALCEHHRAFHHGVGEIIRLFQAGKATEAKQQLLAGAFDTHSLHVVESLIALKRSGCEGGHA